MATAALGLSASRMSVGRVFERAFATVRSNPLVTIGLAMLFGGLPGAGLDYVIRDIPDEAFYMTVGDFSLPGSVVLSVVQWFVGLVVGVIGTGAMTRPVVAFSYGERAPLGACLLTTLKHLPQLLMLGIIFGLCVVIGMSFLVIPALFIYVVWAVAAPALVEEGDGVFLSLSRSQELSVGAKWRVVAVLVVATAAYLLIAAVWLAANAAFTVDEKSPVWIVMIGALQGLILLLWATVQASLYVELRDWKEGPGIDNLEDVFA